MRNWKNIPVPATMASLERDGRGYPIPFIVLRDNTGKPHFQINDTAKVESAITGRLCAVCGGHLPGVQYLVGGPMSAFHPQGAYLDPPTCRECSQYAMQVCPYLAVSRYQNRVDLKHVDPQAFAGAVLTQNLDVPDERVPFYVVVGVSDYRVIYPEPGTRYLVPNRNYVSIEFWNDGQQITQRDAQSLWSNQ